MSQRFSNVCYYEKRVSLSRNTSAAETTTTNSMQQQSLIKTLGTNNINNKLLYR